MSQVFYVLSSDDETGVRNIAVFANGEVNSCDDSHPKFDEILDLVVDGEADPETIGELFDLSVGVSRFMEPLSERVKVADGRVYFDGDVLDNSLAEQIIRFMDEGLSPTPLVNFFERVQNNPQEHSREQLYDWLNKHDFTIDNDGYIIAYKGVTADLKSIHSGPGIVNGVSQNGHLDNSVGNTIEMARSMVQHDPSVGCHTGLHVGTWQFASTFGSGKTLKVRVDPRDVVSVPTDCNWQKVRCCRYTVLEVIDSPVKSAVDPSAYAYDDWDYDDEGYDGYDEDGDEWWR